MSFPSLSTPSPSCKLFSSFFFVRISFQTALSSPEPPSSCPLIQLLSALHFLPSFLLPLAIFVSPPSLSHVPYSPPPVFSLSLLPSFSPLTVLPTLHSLGLSTALPLLFSSISHSPNLLFPSTSLHTLPPLLLNLTSTHLSHSSTAHPLPLPSTLLPTPSYFLTIIDILLPLHLFRSLSQTFASSFPASSSSLQPTSSSSHSLPFHSLLAPHSFSHSLGPVFLPPPSPSFYYLLPLLLDPPLPSHPCVKSRARFGCIWTIQHDQEPGLEA